MPRTIKLGNDNTGITITWTQSAQRLDVDGYYDSFVGIQGKSFELAEFFKDLGITEKDVKNALKDG
jgi:hypothetical protein